MATLGNHMSQIQSLSESEKTHAKEDMLLTNHIQYNEKKGMRDYYDQNVQSILMRNMNETAVSPAANDLV